MASSSSQPDSPARAHPAPTRPETDSPESPPGPVEVLRQVDEQMASEADELLNDVSEDDLAAQLGDLEEPHVEAVEQSTEQSPGLAGKPDKEAVARTQPAGPGGTSEPDEMPHVEPHADASPPAAEAAVVPDTTTFVEPEPTPAMAIAADTADDFETLDDCESDTSGGEPKGSAAAQPVSSAPKEAASAPDAALAGVGLAARMAALARSCGRAVGTAGISALVVLNYPLRWLPESSHTIVNWVALTLLFWVPAIWVIALFVVG